MLLDHADRLVVDNVHQGGAGLAEDLEIFAVVIAELGLLDGEPGDLLGDVRACATDQTMARISSSTCSWRVILDLRLRRARPRDQAGDLGGGFGGLVAGEDSFLLAHFQTPGAACLRICRAPLAKPPPKCQWTPRHCERRSFASRNDGKGDVEKRMKLGSLKAGRDGRLVVVSDDLAWCADAGHIAPTLQAALDDWERIEPQLGLLATDLAHGTIPRERFHEREADAPLPRAYQWADGSAYVNHVELVRKARGAEMPESFWTDPLMYQGGSDEMLGAARPDPARRRGLGLRPRGRDRGGDRRRAARRFAARRRSATSSWSAWSTTSPCATSSRPSSARASASSSPSPPRRCRRCSSRPTRSATPGPDGKLSGVLKVDLNGAPFGRADAGEDMTFDFGTLVAHLARTRNLGAGTIIGSGTVSNRDADGGPGTPGRPRRPRLFLPRRAAHRRDHPRRRAGDALPQGRRHGANLDGGRKAAAPSSARSSSRWWPAEMAGRAGRRGVALALLATAVTVSPGSARMNDPPAAEPRIVGGRAGLVCIWAIYATLLEVGKRCGGARNDPFEAELERSVSRLEDHARRRSPAGAALMADYRARRIDGDAQLCHSDALGMYAQMARVAPEAVRGETDRMLASSPPVEWGSCL